MRSLPARGCYPSILRQRPRHTRTAKPSELYRVLIESCTRPGDLVVDPFCGLDPLQAAATIDPTRRWMSNDVLTPAQVRAQAKER